LTPSWADLETLSDPVTNSMRSSLDERNRFLVELDDATRPLEKPEDITQAAARLLGLHLRVNRCAYADVEPDEDTFNLTGDYNADVESIVGRYTFAQFGAECLRLMRAGEAYVVTDSEVDPRTEAVRGAYRMTRIRSVICVPLRKSGRFVAAMAVHQITPRSWKAEDVELVQLVASRCWESIERARVTRELRESERRLRLAQRAGRIGSFEWDIVSGRIHWSPELERMYGCEVGTFEGTFEGWRKRCVPKDAERVTAEIEQLLSRQQELYDYEFRAIMPDGARRWFRGQAQFEYDASGKPLRMLGVNLDVDEHRRAVDALAESEARFRGVVQTTPECVKIVAPDGSLLFVNRAGLDMLESANEESIADACVFDFIASEHRHHWQQQHARVCAGERLSWQFEIVGLGGTRRWMETHAVPLPLPNGELAQLAVTREITQRKRAETERESLLEAERVARTNAERASALKDEFLATLSHELRTPLNAIIGWTHVLRSGAVDAAVSREGLEVIARNARAQAQIVEDLLDMNRIMAGRLRLDVRQTDLATVVSQALDSVRPTAEAKGVRLQAVIDPQAGLVSGDAGRLQQVFWNLLANGIKFTPRGGKVQVTLERVSSNLEVRVSDTGEGIPPAFLPHVFDRFRQADASTTRRHGGLGLGLAISKQLVELHGGSIRAQSAGAGQGATFTVSLPVSAVSVGRHATAEDRAQPRAALHPETVDSRITLEGVRVMMVDDEPDARHLVQRLLEDHGAHVVTAASAAEAYEHLAQHRFDVLVSDIGMPGEDGYALLRRVRALGRERGGNIAALALTAYARAEDRVRAVLAGFQMYISKPVEAVELVAMVASLAGRTPGSALPH
jgi:PAS domain S-box-containing protein